MIRTIVASRSSSRTYFRRILRLSVTKRHGYKSNRHLADLDQIGGKFQNGGNNTVREAVFGKTKSC